MIFSERSLGGKNGRKQPTWGANQPRGNDFVDHQSAASISSAMASILVTLFQLRAVPVAFSSFSTCRPGELGLPGAVGKVDVEFAAFEMQFLGIGLEAGERRVRLRRRVRRRGRSPGSCRVRGCVSGERSGSDRLPEFVCGAQHHFGAESKFALDRILNLSSPVRRNFSLWSGR